MLCLVWLGAFFTLLKTTASGYVEHDQLPSLSECSVAPNPHTQHLRIPNMAENISQTPGVHHFNPTIIALPYWAESQYILVSRVVTDGLHQESVLCEANICATEGDANRREGEKDCPVDSGLEGISGMYCTTAPVILNIPPTPAEQCDGRWSTFPDIPGFHDPRIFWSGTGEPLVIVNSASQYGCLGLWITDLRAVYEPLKRLLVAQPGNHTSEPPISYAQLTELTRNPASSRAPVEKNWFLFFPTRSTTYIHYNLSPPSLPMSSPSSVSEETRHDHVIPVRREAFEHGDSPSLNTTNTIYRAPSSYGRTFAKVLPHGQGHTTTNLTSPLESPCLTSSRDPLGQPGHWHQATNALKLILCRRTEASAASEGVGSCDVGRSVHFAVMHRKFSNVWDLPLRYERYFVVWDARPPFTMLGVSRYPLLVWNETASGWSGAQNWALETEEEEEKETVEEGGKRSLMMRTSLNKVGSFVGNDTVYPVSNTTNASRAGKEDSWLKQARIQVSKRQNWAYFTYTPSIAWAWRPQSAFTIDEDVLESLNVGYLDDEVILGIGMDDTEQAFARAKAETLLQCLRTCPGIRVEDTSGGNDSARQNAIRSFESEDKIMGADTENRNLLDV